jgi:hypothetical protein
MQTSRFQLSLLIALALALGYSFSSSSAVGYPSGTVSYGANPVISTGGNVDLPWYGSADVTLLGVEPAQDTVITELTIGLDVGRLDCSLGVRYSLMVDGDNVGEYYMASPMAYISGYGVGSPSSEVSTIRMASGVRVPAGSTLTLSSEMRRSAGYCYSSDVRTVHYAVSGYKAQP